MNLTLRSRNYSDDSFPARKVWGTVDHFLAATKKVGALTAAISSTYDNSNFAAIFYLHNAA